MHSAKYHPHETMDLSADASYSTCLLEDSNVCGCSCIDKEPKDLGINDIENDVGGLDEGHR